MMEFRSLTNIETSFKQIRLYAAAFVVLCLVITAIVVYSSYAFANRQREKIYVLDNGKSLILALSQDAAANRPVEAREHVRRFHELFFTVAPDKDAIEKNMERAFLLCDKTAGGLSASRRSEETARHVSSLWSRLLTPCRVVVQRR